ncbi:MAG: ABC transporter permease [Azospira oryzae]|jgi:putative ABC transport system permease protein|nr:MAG: ABC transporter permease [Azospira oryzae]
MKRAFRLLHFFCPDQLYEEIEGDLIQKFNKDVKAFGEKRARRRLLWNTIRFCRPGIVLRNTFSMRISQWDMINHFMKIFWRTSRKNANHSFMTISGLAIGIAACMLIGFYVQKEKSYDQFHTKKDQIFRVRHDRLTNGVLTRQWAAGPMSIGADLKNDFPEVKRFVLLNRGSSGHYVISNGEKFFKEGRIFYSSADFFRLFSFPLLKGVDSLVLRDPFTMVVSESFAKRYFNNEDPVGKTMKCNGKDEYTVTGVFKDVPENTHLKFDALFSFESLVRILGPAEMEDLMSNWGWEGNFTYIELKEGSDFKVLQAKLPAFVERKAGDLLRSWNEWMEFTLQPLTSIHLNSHTPDEIEANGDQQSVNFLTAIAVFILLMAWINYINMATARSMERAREVGIRKVLGSDRSKLIRQFLFEAFTTNLIALLIAIVLVTLLLPSFSNMIQGGLDWKVFQSMDVWMAIGLTFTVGVIASGFYPALVMSGFAPVSIMTGKFKNSVKGVFLRKGLVTIQFVSSVILIIGTFAVYEQLQFMLNSPKGIDTGQTLVIEGPNAIDSTYLNKVRVFFNTLQQHSGVDRVTVSTDVPGQKVRNSNGNVHLVGQDIKEGNAFQAIMTDESFIAIYGLNLIAGKNFSGKLKDQWKTVIVNETAMKLLGFTNPEKLIGQKMYLWDSEPAIIGVIKDYHQEYMKQNIKPLVLVYDQEVTNSVLYSIKINDRKSINDVIQLAEKEYNKIFPGNIVSYSFLDEHYDRQYKFDRQFGKIVSIFTFLAIIIACLGLFGLSSYIVIQRTKEIGIRKVLGASFTQVTSLISKEFVLLVAFACLIALPLAYYVIDHWLQGYAFHISLDPYIFLFPAAFIFMIAILTVVTHSLKAALADPVDSLRSE